MRILDPQVKDNLGSALHQSGLVTLVILLVVLFLDILIGPAVVAALGSTAFVMFAMPHSAPAQPRRLLGGNVIGILTGTGASLLAGCLASRTAITPQAARLLFSAVAVGAAIFAIVITDTAHNPAAGLCDGRLECVYSGLCWSLSSCWLWPKRLLRRYLRNLV